MDGGQSNGKISRTCCAQYGDDVQVVKRSGEREEFSRWKTTTAIRKLGASQDEAEGIVRALEPQRYDGITTEELYHRV
jgi:hypothetical protein